VRLRSRPHTSDESRLSVAVATDLRELVSWRDILFILVDRTIGMAAQLRLLHVDDDPGFLEVSSTFFSGRDDRIETVSVESADEAVEYLRSNPVDCLVSDSVRVSDGDLLVRAARDQDPDLPIVLFTAKEWEEVADDAAAARVAGYVQKTGTDEFERVLDHLSRLLDEGEPTAMFSPAGDVEHLGTALTDDWHFLTTVEWDDEEELGTLLVEAVEAYLGENDAVPPLYDVLDAGALDDLLRPSFSGRRREGVQVRFPYRDHLVAMTSEGVVAVRPSDATP
jgi:CheY-like chemotaxis protein